MSEQPRIHIAKSPCKLADGKVYRYAYVRYEVWDEKKGRYQPKPLASLGRTDRLDEERVESLGGFLREWLRKDSSLPFDALKDRFEELEASFRILCSRDFGLRWIIEQAWEELGYRDAIEELCDDAEVTFPADLAIFAMVVSQLVAPRSKRGLANWNGVQLFFPEADHLPLQHLYRAMDVLEAGYEEVERSLAERLTELGVETSVLKHDSTTIGFSVRYDDKERANIEKRRKAAGKAIRDATVNAPPLRMRGHSKAKRPDLPQVVLEAVLGDHDLVVHHKTHPGNTSDFSLTADTAEALVALGYREVQWVGDSGTNSVKNRNALRAERFDFVLGEGIARTKVVKEVLKQPGRYRSHPQRPELSFKCVVTEATDEINQGHPSRKRLYIIRRNKKEQAHALHRLNAHLEKIKGILDKGSEKAAKKLLTHRTLKRYVRRDARRKDEAGRPAGRVILDREAVARARRNAGKSVIGTDVLDTDPLDADTVYRSLFDIEQVFRQLKTTIKVGPIRHRRADRIRAHVMIAVMALNLAAWLERKTGHTFEYLQDLFANYRVQQVQMGNALFWEVVELEDRQKEVLDKLGYDEPPKRFTATVATANT